jgi:hypothetical protein
MSSATSTNGKVRLKPAAAANREKVRDEADGSFSPWHFFLLAALMTATVAVVMARPATPEHLVLTSLTIAAAGGAAAAFYRMLAPLAIDDATMFSEPLSARARATLEREKALVLRSIKELEFDRAMGKVSPKDFDEMAGRLRTRAITLMKQLDDQGTGTRYRELIERELTARLASAPRGSRSPRSTGAADAGACAACGTANDPDAIFCKRCGAKLQETISPAASQ